MREKCQPTNRIPQAALSTRTETVITNVNETEIRDAAMFFGRDKAFMLA